MRASSATEDPTYSNARGAVAVADRGPDRAAVARFLGISGAAAGALLPGDLWPRACRVEYPEALPEWGNLVRATLQCQLPTRRLDAPLEAIRTSDPYLATLKQWVRKRLRTVPLNQDTPLSARLTLSVSNTSMTETRVVLMREFELAADKHALPKNWAGPFLPDIPLAELRPGKNLHITCSVREAREVDPEAGCHSAVCACASFELEEARPGRGVVVEFHTDGTADPRELLDRAERNIRQRLADALAVPPERVDLGGAKYYEYTFLEEPSPQLAAYLAAEVLARDPAAPQASYDRLRVDRPGTFLRVHRPLPELFPEL